MLHVFHIDAGRMLTFDIGYAAEKVATLQEALTQTVHAPATEQILLISGGEVLDNPERRVSRYCAGTDSNPIFLVCRPTGEFLGQSSYGASSTSPTPDLANTSEMENQVYQASQSQLTFQSIQLCAQLARRLVQSADANVDKCSQLVYDQHLLHQGWLAVIANLDDTIGAFQQRLMKFRKKIERFASQHQRDVDLLAAFETDAQLLKRIPLLPCLLPIGESTQSQSAMLNVSLFDWISSNDPEHSLHDLARDATQTLDRLMEPKILESLTTFEGATLERAQDISMKEIGGLGKRLARLDEYLQHVKKLQVEQRQYADSLRSQEQRAVTVNDSSIIADLCSSHLSALKKMIERQKQIADITRRFYEAKTELLKNIHLRLRWVTDTHQLIQTGDSKVLLHGERLHRLGRQLQLLRQLHDAPFVYASAVTEVVRRKAFSREFSEWADRLTDKSKQLHSDENRLREIFSEKFDKHFLRTLFPGMEDRIPEFVQDAPEPFDKSLPAVEVAHVRELRSAVPQLQHILCIQKPAVLERLEEKGRQSLRRDASFFSQTPPKYAANVPVSGSAPVIIHSRSATGYQSPSWFAGDEMEFSPPTERASGGFLATAASPTAPITISDEARNARRRQIVTSDSDSETMASHERPSSVANGGVSRSAPIRIPMANRSNESVGGVSTAMMTASRDPFSEKGGSSGKFGTPNEHLLEMQFEDEERTNEEIGCQTSINESITAAVQSISLVAAADTLTKELEEKASRLAEAMGTEQTLRRQLTDREVLLENYRTLLNSKVLPELVEFRGFFEEIKRMFEEFTSANAKSNDEWSDIIDRAARKLESNLQTDLEKARKAEDELRKSELGAKLDELRTELEEEKQRARDFQKQFENSDAFLKQKDDVIELLQQRLQEQETAYAKELEEVKTDLLKRLLIEQELTADSMRVEYEREIEIKDGEIQQLKQELSEKQQVLREMKREQDRLVASMCEREVVSDFVNASASLPADQQRSEDIEEKLRQVRMDVEREYKDKLQMLTAGLEARHAQQLERVRKEKEVEVRLLKLQLEQASRLGETSVTDDEVVKEETASACLEAWKPVDNMADAMLDSVRATTASTAALFQEGLVTDKEGEDEQEDEEFEESIQKERTDSESSKVVSPEDSKRIVATKSKAVQTKADRSKVSVLRISKGDLVLLVFDPQFKTYVVFSVSPTLYILKDSCLQRMGVRPFAQTPAENGDSPRLPTDALPPKQRWILGKVVELDYCQIKKPTNRYRLPMNTRFFRVATEPVVLKTQP